MAQHRSDDGVVKENGESEAAGEAHADKTDAGATAVDSLEGDLTVQIVAVNPVKTLEPAVYTNTPIITTIGSAKAALEGIAALKEKGYGVKPLQEFL